MFSGRIIGASTLAVLFLGALCPAEQTQEPALTPKDLETIWIDFTHRDDAGARKAFQGIRQLSRAPGLAVPFLKERLKAVAVPDPQRIDRLIADLDGNDFNTREKATKELEVVGVTALPAIRKKLADKALPLEMRNRLAGLQQQLEDKGLTAEELRGVRAVEVLSAIRSAEAIALLEHLAKGADGALLTEDARRALTILGRAGK